MMRRKFFLTIVCIVFCLMKTQAQNDTILTIEQVYNTVGRHVYVCADMYDRAIVQAPCNDCGWLINNNEIIENQSYVIFDGNVTNHYYCVFSGCGYAQLGFIIDFIEPNVPNDTYEEIWKRQCDTITLEAVGADSANMYTYFWPHNGATTRTVEVCNQGTYVCLISDMCATAVRTKNVEENVEIELATCDLSSNLNMITYPTDPVQAQYIHHLDVKRDGIIVGSTDYSTGYFIDNIGSDAAARTYTLVAVKADGTVCSIESRPKETIHMAYLTGINSTVEINWNNPNGYDLIGFNICEYHPDGKEDDLTVIDFVGSGVTSYTCLESQFNEGNIVVQGVEVGKGRTENRLLSNRSWETVSVSEESQHQQRFEIYPNPANGVITVKAEESELNLTIVNMMGQVIWSGTIYGGVFTTPRLSPGLYIVKCNGGTEKVVVK